MCIRDSSPLDALHEGDLEFDDFAEQWEIEVPLAYFGKDADADWRQETRMSGPFAIVQAHGRTGKPTDNVEIVGTARAGVFDGAKQPIKLEGYRTCISWDVLAGNVVCGPDGLACRLVPARAPEDAEADALEARQRASVVKLRLDAEHITRSAALTARAQQLTEGGTRSARRVAAAVPMDSDDEESCLLYTSPSPRD